MSCLGACLGGFWWSPLARQVSAMGWAKSRVPPDASGRAWLGDSKGRFDIWWKLGWDCLPHVLEQPTLLKWPLPCQAHTLSICHSVQSTLLTWKRVPRAPGRIKCFLNHFHVQTASQTKCRFACYSSPVSAGFKKQYIKQKQLLATYVCAYTCIKFKF